ncbi:reactive intermediate/imine deaminase [Campylobacter sp. MIT 12-8780]|uniref:Rid family detoxifying hydrolase n=1 Tax=Campylobacter sp. MIT 12-8780 TaxID=2202200 RepID=UPI00115EB9DA|nr:Rid family detoxifying hydrolase [Campylobacter sp. MIT 12-8780]TQR41218.1 reactive intermediate/imine deaminase [Campylobacter sp. MIT 12-8780]
MQKYPKALGAYSVYRKANGFLFVSGQLPLDPQTNEFIQGGIKEQTKQALENIKAILEENDMDFSCVLKSTVFLADINDFIQMNEVYASYFDAPYPARSAFAVKDLPKGSRIEIEVIAFKG